MTYKFTPSAKNVVEYANEIALKLGHEYIGTEHILYGLAKEDSGISNKVLISQNINTDNIITQIEELIGPGKIKSKKILGFTPRTKKILENASIEAKKLGSEYIGTEHLLIGIIKEGDSVAVRILINLEVNIKGIYEDILKLINEDTSEENKMKSRKEVQEKNNSFSRNSYY